VGFGEPAKRELNDFHARRVLGLSSDDLEDDGLRSYFRRIISISDRIYAMLCIV